MDWIDTFMDYTEGITSPHIYRLWSAITAVSGALERRAWTVTARRKIYPNLYTLLVGAPGVGKTAAIEHVDELWRSVKEFHVAPNNMTRASLLDSLEGAQRTILIPGDIVEYHTMLIAADEFGVLVPAHDLEFLSVINKLFDCPNSYVEERRHIKKRTEIIQPQTIMLAGSQPGFMASLLPDEAWTMGFTSRLIMIYSDQKADVDLFDGIDPRIQEFQALAASMNEMSKRYGLFHWHKDASAALKEWNKTRCAPEPEHVKLLHYSARRIMYVIKLCMIASASRGGDMIIMPEDLNRAREWLLDAEKVMPMVFAEMNQRSDGQLIAELHYYMWRLYAEKKEPIHEQKLFWYLQKRTMSERIPKVIEIAERSGIISHMAGTALYVPRPKNLHGA